MATTTENIEKAEKVVSIGRRLYPDVVSHRRKAVVVHSGARDAYQVALALSEAGLLDALVTDLFWPLDNRRACALASLLPARASAPLLQRTLAALPSSRVRQSPALGIGVLLAEKLPGVPRPIKRWITRRADAALGKKAGELAARTGSAMVSYSYYGFQAFRSCGKPGMLFQMHPHPMSMRRILSEELQAHPDCANSLKQEWELALPEVDFQHLVREVEMASSFMVASSFTRNTLIEHGSQASQIRVIPYGVDCTRFRPDRARRAASGAKLHLLFVGRINQRKGIKYLLQALRLLETDRIHLTVCGRVVDDLELFKTFDSQVTIRPSVSPQELVAAYQSADLFVFPSVAEGFGQVLLESLACGLPILSTTHTAAPDLIVDGQEGFIVEPRRPDQIAERLEWALQHRAELIRMGERARAAAERFTLPRFRSEVAAAVADFLALHPTAGEEHHV